MPKDFATRIEQEARISKLKEEIEAILCKAFADNVTWPASKSMLIQTGLSSIRNDTAVTFSRAFKAGAIPTVVGTVVSTGTRIFTLSAAPNNAHFHGYVHDDAGALQTENVYWIAIGERA